MARQWAGTWAGGRCSLSRGRKRWILERSFLNRQHTFTLAARDEQGALAALHAWNEDPGAFVEAHEAKRRRQLGQVGGKVLLGDSAIAALEADMRRRGLSEKHVRNSVAYARQWVAALGPGTDMRFVTRLQVQKALAAHPGARHHRVTALKVLGAWLVDTGQLEAAQSPGRLVVVPPSVPERSVRAKGYSPEVLAKMYSHLSDQDVRDFVRIAAHTGAHGTELSRLCGNLARLEAPPPGTDQRIRLVWTVWHKRNSPHTISLDASCADAALRLQRLGKVPSQTRVHQKLRKASLAAGVPQCRAGEIRHSWASYAQRGQWVSPTGGAGVALVELTEVSGHRSVGTLARFYAAPPVPRLLDLSGVLQLHHASDPTPSALDSLAPAR